MIYSNVTKSLLKNLNIQPITISKVVKLLKKENTLFIDTETYAYKFDRDALIYEYLQKHISQNKKVTATTKRLSEQYAESIREDMALNPYESRIRMLQIATTNDIFILDSFEDDLSPVFLSMKYKNIAGHNLKFDLKVIETSYLNLEPLSLFDTMIAHRLLLNRLSIERYESHLKSVVEYWLGIKMSKGWGNKDWGIKELFPEQVTYCIEDVQYLSKICDIQIQKLNIHSLHTVKPYFNGRLTDLITIIEMKFIEVLVETELRGIPINIDFFKQRIKELKNKIPSLQKNLKDINVNSPQQVLELFESYDIYPENTSESELIRLAPHYKIAKQVLELRKSLREITILSQYCDIQNQGRIFPSFNQIESRSGRMSCRKPNTQQIKRTLKNSFYKVEKGKAILRSDYPSIEPRIIAVVSKDVELINCFKNKKDPYRVTASFILGIEEQYITDLDRLKIKAVFLGFMYGMGVTKFISYAYENYNIHFSVKEAEKLKIRFFSLYSGIQKYHRKNGFTLAEHPIIQCSTLFGRVMVCNKFTDANNYPVQGTGADILKYASVLFYNKCKENNIKAYIINYIHDELVVETLKENTKKVHMILRTSMEYACDTILHPIKTEVEISTV